jgi:hypothetical protein
MKIIFFYIISILISLIKTQNEEEMLSMAKASACMAIGRSKMENPNSSNKQELFEGLTNCYYKISESQLMNLVQLIRDGKLDFKGTEYEELASGREFIKNFPNEDDRKNKIIEFQKVLENLRKAQENMVRGDNNYENNNPPPKNVKGVLGGIKYLFLKGIFSIMQIINGYVLIGILIILSFFTLRSCSKLCSKGKKIKKNVSDEKNDKAKDEKGEKVD